jgi:hypothetical protein
MPRSGKVLIGPSADAIRPLIIRGLKNRSVGRSCVRLSVKYGGAWQAAHWPLPKKHVLAAELLPRGLAGIELTHHVELRRGRKIHDLLKLGHEVDLAAAFEDVDALLGGDHGVAFEIGGPLLELGEVFDRLQRPLRAEQPLDVHAEERRRVDAMAKFPRPESPGTASVP